MPSVSFARAPRGIAMLPLLLMIGGIAMAAASPYLGAPLFGAISGVIGASLALWGGSLLRGSGDTAKPAAAPTPTLQDMLPKPAVETVAKRDFDKLQTELDRYKAVAEEFQAAKQEAEAAMMAKGEFLATMSHEIRTPLNGIIPLLDIMLGTPLTQDQKEYLTTAYSSSKQLLNIVDDILDYSKIEAGKLELETVGLNLKELLESVTRLMARNAEKKGLQFSVHLDPNVRLAVRGDPTRLRQVLTNLVSNAIKFTDRGGVEIRITKRSETRTHNEVMFAIRDTGIGLSEEAQAKLFRPFSQADSSTTRTFGGTGLGLMICKRIVDLMGGQIGVKSELGKGSIFWFTAPMLKAVGDVSLPRRDLHGSKAIIVSNDTEVLRRLAGMLNNMGVQHTTISVAGDVITKMRSAIAMGPRWAFDFLVLDFASANVVCQQIANTVLAEAQFNAVSFLGISSGEEIPSEIRVIGRYTQVSRLFGEPELRESLQGLLAGESKNSGQSEEAAVQVAVSQTPSIGDMDHTSSKPVSGHVLLVEDNPVNRQVAQRLLSLIGITHDAAENGKQGMEKYQAGQYQAILMDCQMPIMDGYTATRNIRKLEGERQSKRTPIIAMTANAMVGDREKCLGAGMDDYMSKPLNRALLEQMLRRWLPQGTGAGPAGKATASPTAAGPEARMTQPALADRTASAGDGALKKEIVEDLIDVMGSMFKELISVYLEDAPKNLSLLEQGAQQQQNDALIAPAHSLKSTSANLGALRLSEMAKQVEHGARTGILGDARARVQSMRQEFARVEHELRALLQNAD